MFYGFEMATENYIVIRSEDQMPDTEKIIFIEQSSLQQWQ